MRIAAVSDSHGEIENLRKAFRRSTGTLGAEVFIHLGDDYDDVDCLPAGNVRILRVPGIYSSHYSDPSVMNRQVRVFNEWRFLLSHTPIADGRDMPGDADPEEVVASGNADVLLHGHTHVPEAVMRNGYVKVNPGNLRSNDKRGYPPTFCVMDVDGDVLDVSIHLLDAEATLLSGRFDRKKLGS